MQVEWIESFLAIVETGNFRTAAATLYRAQSRVSAHMASLETEIGVELFDRSRRPVALTDAGKAFLPHARTICVEIDAGRLAARSASRDARGHVVLGVYPSAGAQFVPGVVREFSARCPEATLEFSEHAIAGLDAALSHNVISMAVRPEEPRFRAAPLIVVPLWLEPMLVVSPASGGSQDEAPVPITELADVPLLVTGTPEAVESEARNLLVAHGVEVNVAYQSDQPQTLIGLVRSGLGIGLTNSLALRTTSTDGMTCRPTDPPLYRRVNLVRRPDKSLSAAAEKLWSIILSAPLPQGMTDLRKPARG